MGEIHQEVAGQILREERGRAKAEVGLGVAGTAAGVDLALEQDGWLGTEMDQVLHAAATQVPALETVAQAAEGHHGLIGIVIGGLSFAVAARGTWRLMVLGALTPRSRR